MMVLFGRDVAGLFLNAPMWPKLGKKFPTGVYRHPLGFGWLGLASRRILVPLQVPSDRHGEATLRSK